MSKADLIDRQAAVDTLEKIPVREFKKSDDGLLDALVSIGQVYRALNQLPPVQPEPQWIPCSERLPKPYEYCLWTTTDGRVVYHHCDGLFSNYTAWMPLPEPYKGES